MQVSGEAACDAQGDPEGLDGYAKQVGRAGEDARAIGGYLHRYPPPDGTWSSGGSMKLMGETGPRAFAAAEANLATAGTLPGRRGSADR
ncbi:hypothetical protein KRM28CT15_19610 [Krasilnikovia sp. M28-CT-15]